ncbi:hypothetical protein [Nocardia cyriacigeorgica]|nr:hypothetical protein [Nocardia cyriacigeorgica]
MNEPHAGRSAISSQHWNAAAPNAMRDRLAVIAARSMSSTVVSA